jgi:hypothetical protein
LICGLGMVFYRLEAKMPRISAELIQMRATKEV